MYLESRVASAFCGALRREFFLRPFNFVCIHTTIAILCNLRHKLFEVMTFSELKLNQICNAR